MKKLALALVLVAALAGLTLVLRSVLAGPSEKFAPLAPTGEPATGRAAGGPVTPLVGTDELPERGPGTLAETVPLAARSAIDPLPDDLDGGATLPIRGHVTIPDSAPADPTLRVLALSAALGPAEVYGEIGAVAKLAQEGSHPIVVDIAGVDPNGAFELSFPADDPVGWIALDGRYLYSKRCAQVDLDDPGTPAIVPAGLGSWVTGQVRLPEGVEATPEVFARMQATFEPDSTQFSMMDQSGMVFDRETSIDAEGRFAFRGIDTGRAYEIEVADETLANYRRDGLQLEAGSEYAIDAEMVVGATLRGRVVDTAERPVSGAEVRAFRHAAWGFPGSTLARAETDDEGRFELFGIPPGRGGVLAKLDGKLESPSKSITLANEEVREGLELVVHDGSSISGSVRWDDQRPATDVTVRVSFDPKAMAGASAFNAARGASGKATTDEQGHFHVTGLGKGPFLVRVETERSDGNVWVAVEDGVEPGHEGLELTLATQPSLKGGVVDGAGEPIEDFRVIGNSAGGVFWMPGESVDRTFSDKAGQFELTALAEGVWTFEARAKGYGPSAPVEAALPRPEGSERTEFILVPAATVTGVVVDPNGAPIAGARVTIVVDAAQNFAQITGRIDAPEVFTKDDGTFELSGLSIGSHAIVAKHGNYADSEAAPVELEAGQTTDDVVLRLMVGGTLAGMIYDKSGEPMQGGQVFIQNTSDWETVSKRTDSEGGFRVEQLRAGDWQITAMAGTIDPGSGDEGDEGNTPNFFDNMRFTVAKVVDGEETFVVLGAPPEDPTVVFGRVTHDGDPVGSAMVSFFPEGSSGFEAMRFQQLDADGEYEIELDKPGSYLVQVQSHQGTGYQQNNVEYSKTIPAGDRHRLDLELPLGRVSGHVKGPDGKPLGSGRVTLTTDGGVGYGTFMGGQYAESATDENGAFDFEYLRPGTYSVAAGGSVFGGAFGSHSQEGRVVMEGIQVSAGQHVDGLDFRLERSGEITGVVSDATGRPASGVAIFVRDQNGNLLERFSMISTGADGRFRYTGVAPGRYIVMARSTNEASLQSQPVQVLSTETATVALSLGPATVLRIQVIDKRGEEVRARLSVLAEDGSEVNGMLAYADLVGGLGEGFSTREQRVGPLTPGRYTIIAITDDGRTAKKPVTLSGQPKRSLKLRIK